MVEGKEWENFAEMEDEQTATSKFVRPIVMIDGSEDAMNKVTDDINQHFDEQRQKIIDAHLDPDSVEAKSRANVANAFQKIFAERRKLN